MTDVHVVRYYATGIGHVEARGERFLVTFHGPRTKQAWADTLQAARYALRRLARG